MLQLIIFIFLSQGYHAAPTGRRQPGDIPAAPLSNGNCRLRINEINTYPPGKNQFIELIRICKTPPTKVFEVAMEDKSKASVYKLAIVTHEEEIIGVCDLSGRGKTRHGDNMFYTIAAEAYSMQRDFKIEDCHFANDYKYYAGRHRFPSGDNFPLAITLIHNSSPKVIHSISLDGDEVFRKKVKIDMALRRKIQENVQDVIVVASSSPYTHCSYFKELFSGYDGESGYIVRDWMQDQESDYSRSRCTQIPENNWLPFHPDDYLYAPASPNAPNVCEKGIKFRIEDGQIRRSIPIVFSSQVSKETCIITTEDPAILSVQMITDPFSYGRQMTTALEQKNRLVSTAVQAIINSEPGDCENPAPTQDDIDSCQVEFLAAQSFEALPISTSDFENQLEHSVPFIWDSCQRVQPKNLAEILRQQNNPDINPNYFTDQSVCFWLDYDVSTSKFSCKLCQKLLKQGIIMDTKGSKLLTMMITSNQGYKGTAWAKSANSRIIEKHKDNPLHKISLHYFELFDSGKRGEELQQEFEKSGSPFRQYLNATENVMVTAFQSTRLDIPFDKFHIQIETMNFFNISVGNLHGNAAGSKIMLMSMSDTLHEDLITRLKKEEPVLSVMVDTSTDVASIGSLTVVFHIFGDGSEVEVKLYRIMHEAKGETGSGLFEIFTDALRRDGLEDYVKENTIGFSSDGGPNVKKFRGLFNGYVNKNLVLVHCMAHRLELSIKKAWKQMSSLKEIDEVVGAIYSIFNSRSAKKKLILAAAAKEQGEKAFEVKRIIATRWMASKARAISAVYAHWKPIVSALHQIKDDKSFQIDQRAKSSYALQSMLDPATLSTLAFIADTCEVLGTLSVQLQERGTSIIGKREKRDVLQDTLRRLQDENGPRLESLLKEAKIKDKDGNGVTLTEFEENSILYQDYELISEKSIPALSVTRGVYLDPLIEQIDAYYPEDVTDTFDILDPTRWSAGLLENFGNTELQELNVALKWKYDAETLKGDWQDLKLAVYSAKEFSDMRKLSPEAFWKYFLELPTIQWPATMKTIVKNILAVQSSTAEVERIYSMYTHTKTPQRYCLDVTTVEAIVRVKFNGPKRLEDFKSTKYAQNFIKKHSRCDDTSRRTTWNKRAREVLLDEVVDPNAKCPRIEDEMAHEEIMYWD